MKRITRPAIVSAVLLGIAVVGVPTSFVFAQEDATDSAIQQSLKDRLQKAVDERDNQVQGVQDDQRRKRGIIGTVRRISEETLTLETKNGPLILPLTSEIAFIEKDKAIKIADVEIDNQVAVLGYQDNDEFEPRRILVYDTPLSPTDRTIIVGNVVSITANQVEILPRGTSENKTFTINRNTNLEDSEKQELTFRQVEVDSDVLLIVTSEDSTARSTNNSSGQVKLLHTLSVVAEE